MGTFFLIALAGYVSTLRDNNSSRIDPTKEIFPMVNYPQEISQWIPSDQANYKLAFMDQKSQEKHFSILMHHYFGNHKEDSSPWNKAYISSLLATPEVFKETLYTPIRQFEDPHLTYYGENFMVLDQAWKSQIVDKASVSIANKFASYARGITVRETAVRLLPTDTPVFEDPRQAGQGYPFDVLQYSALAPGTPVYIAGVTKDRSWSFIVSPAETGWVDSSDLAKVNNQFLTAWRAMAAQGLVGVVNDNASFYDKKGVFFCTGRTGTLLPFKRIKGKKDVALPTRSTNGYAIIRYIAFSTETMRKIPIAPTPENMAYVIRHMQGKPYGWGNLYHFNDCSAEIKNLMAPFGIFMPRQSNNQSMMMENRVDLSHFSTEERLHYLVKYGKPFLTVIYIKGHIMLYIGNVEWKGKIVPMTYQNIWGLKDTDLKNRSIIGKSVFFPLLSSYSENKRLKSPAEGSTFILTNIN